MKGIFMPGRLNSERLPNKLILPIGDTCLWEIACKKLSEISDEFEKCVLLSSEDKPLINTAEKYGLNIIIRDPKTTKIDNPLNKVFGDIKYMSSDTIMFLNPCLPFLKKETIEKALSDNSYFCESVKPFNNWLYHFNGELITNIKLDEMNTKTIETLYQPAHAFRIFNKNIFIKTGLMSSNQPRMHEITELESLDVDTIDNFEYIKYRWKK